MSWIGHGGAGDLHTFFYKKLFELMKHPISLWEYSW
tara:strand:+ start:302 stop:409 length:108 start_codon:yes stop_codon:yes gene_type:complete